MIDRLTSALVAGFFFGSAVSAETESVRLGRHFLYSVDQPYSELRNIAEVQDQLKFHMTEFVSGFDGCPDIVSHDLNDGTPRDQLRDTWTIIQTFSVECWAVLQVYPTTPVAPTGKEDLITPEIIHGIMAHAGKLSSQNDEWFKTLMTFSEGVITCKDDERCLLSLPDGENPPEQSLLFELIAAQDEDRLILVTQMVYGRSGFVYGVRWRETEGGGEVISIFPDLKQ